MARKQKGRARDDREATVRPKAPAPASDKHRVLLTMVVLVLALATLPYINAIDGDFVLDDVNVIVENPLIRDLGNLGKIFSTDYWSGTAANPAAVDPGLYRPLTTSSYAVDFQMWQLAPAGYHAVNIALHAIASVLVLLLALRILGAPLPAFAAAGIFAVHPVHTEAVTGIVGRAEVLAALFFMLAFFLARPAKAGIGRALAAAACYLLAMFSKEIAATLPLVLLLDDWLRRDELAGAGRAAAVRNLVTRYTPLAVAAALYLVIRHQAVTHPAQIWTGFLGVSAGDRTITGLRVLVEYLGLFIFPRTLLADYWRSDVPIASAVDPAALFAIALLVGVVIAAVRLRADRVVVLTMGWFAITILPVSNILFPIGVGKAERILYLPSVGLCLLAGWAMTKLERTRVQPWLPRAVLAAVLVALAARTYRRNADWRDALTLAEATLRDSPESPLMNDIAAGELLARNAPDRAISLLRVAVAGMPEQSLFQNHLGTAYYRTGKLDSAAAHLTAAIRLRPTDADAHSNLGAVYLDQGRLDEATAELQAALRVNPRHLDAHINLGSVYLSRQQLDLAAAEFMAAVAARPESPEAHNNLGVAYLRSGRLDSAAAHFQEAVRLRPGNVNARNNLDAVAKQRAVKPTP